MRKSIYKSFCLIALLMLIPAVIQIVAQTPTPSPTPVPESPSLSVFLQSVVTNFNDFKTVFVQTVEGTLGGYFAVLAYILAWVIAMFYFFQQFIQGEWDASQLGRFTGSIVACLVLLVFCGDVDGDGRRGDIVQIPTYVGYQLAFGNDPQEPTGSYINNLVNTERGKFNENYQQFVENKLMVKINNQDMPVRYPGMAAGVQKVAAIAVGNPPKPGSAEEKEIMSQAFQVGLLFQILDFFRSLIGIIDFFLLVLYVFGILICTIIAPFMCCVFVNRDLRKRFTYPFLWTVFTVTVIFPAISQTARYFAYFAGNIALGTGGNPVYTFDPQTFTIVANGNPIPMIVVAVLMMLVSIVLLVMSLILSYSFAQGKLVESISGLIANTFAGLGSIGLGAVVSSVSARMGIEASKTSIEAASNSAGVLADSNLKAQQAALEASRRASQVSALGGEQAAITGAVGDAQAKTLSDVGNLLVGQGNAQIQSYSTKAGAYADAANIIANNSQQANEELAKKSLSSYLESERITDESDKQKISDAFAETNIKGDNWDNYLESLGPLGTVGKQFLNGRTVEALSGRSIINAAGAGDKPYDPKAPIKLSNGSEFSIGDFIEKGVMPNIRPTAPTNSVQSRGGISTGLDFSGANQGFQPTATSTPVVPEGYMAVPAINGDPQWDKDNLTQYAAGYGFKSITPTGANQVSIATAGSTPEQITNFRQNAEQYGIQTSRNGENLILSDTPSAPRIPRALQTTDTRLPRVGTPNIPSALHNPLSARLSQQAAQKPLSNGEMIYYDPSQEKSFVSTGNKQYDAWLLGAAREHKVNPNLLKHQFVKESQFKKGAVSNKGATGIAQIMPATGTRLGVTDLKDPAQSIYGGAKYMRFLADFMRVNGNVQDGRKLRSLALAGYNAGEGAVQKRGFVVPPFAETQDYVQKITGNVDRFNQTRPPLNPNGYIQDLNRYTKPEAELMSKRYSNLYGKETGLRRAALDNQVSAEITRQSLANKQNIAVANLGSRYTIADTVENATNANLAQGYSYNKAATQTTLNARLNQAAISRNTGLEVAEIQYEGGSQQALWQYHGQIEAAKITKDAALDALYKQNAANLVQSVGNTISHQLSELFERASRGL